MTAVLLVCFIIAFALGLLAGIVPPTRKRMGSESVGTVMVILAVIAALVWFAVSDFTRDLREDRTSIRYAVSCITLGVLLGYMTIRRIKGEPVDFAEVRESLLRWARRGWWFPAIGTVVALVMVAVPSSPIPAGAFLCAGVGLYFFKSAGPSATWFRRYGLAAVSLACALGLGWTLVREVPSIAEPPSESTSPTGVVPDSFHGAFSDGEAARYALKDSIGLADAAAGPGRMYVPSARAPSIDTFF